MNFKDEKEYNKFALYDEVEDYEKFMEEMECGNHSYCGVHDCNGDVDDDGVVWEGYSSYEIEDYDKAIEKWREFFSSKNVLLN